MRNPKKKTPNLTKLFSCKSFRILKKDNGDGFEVSISKKYFKLAVDRNKIKRRVKEIIRKNGYSDFLSNGFKLRESGTDVNQSGITYIYIAFAEHPFVGDGVSPATAR